MFLTLRSGRLRFFLKNASFSIHSGFSLFLGYFRVYSTIVRIILQVGAPAIQPSTREIVAGVWLRFAILGRSLNLGKRQSGKSVGLSKRFA